MNKNKNKNSGPTAAHTHRRGNYRGKDEQLIITKDIFDLLPNHTDNEIMHILKIPYGTYYRYKAKIYEECKELWQQTAREGLEFQALQIISSLRECIKINHDIGNDKGQLGKDRIEASVKLVDTNIMIYNVLENGPKPSQIQVTLPTSEISTKCTDQWIEANSKKVSEGHDAWALANLKQKKK